MSVDCVNQILTPTRQRSKASPYLPSYMEEGQLCIVCGDTATGLHYRAITCEGCKGFWRRTEQRHLTYVCKNGDEKCVIDKNNRNCCQKCRYNKCKDVGMSSALVLNENERAQKRELIKGNREKRVVEEVLLNLRSPAHEYQKEKTLYAFIEMVTRSYCAHIDQPLLRPSQDLSEKEGYVELIRQSVRRIRDFAENFEVFDKLNQATQESYLRGSLLEIHVLRFLSLFDPIDMCFHPSKSEKISVNDLDAVIGEERRELVNKMLFVAGEINDLQMDLRQMAILSSLFFFNPDNHPESNQEAMRIHLKLWDSYRYLCDEGYDYPNPKRWSRLVTNVMSIRIICNELDNLLVNSKFQKFFSLLTSKDTSVVLQAEVRRK